MKEVLIDNKKGIVKVEGRQIPRLLLGIIQGAVGKCFVVKHYRGKKGRRVVVTRYPDMSGIVASEKQRERRNLFREAVVYARWIVGEEERKKAFQMSLPRKKRKQVYQAAIRLYMSRQGDAGWLRKQLAVRGMMRASAEKGVSDQVGYRKGRDSNYTWEVKCVPSRFRIFLNWGNKSSLHESILVSDFLYFLDAPRMPKRKRLLQQVKVMS